MGEEAITIQMVVNWILIGWIISPMELVLSKLPF